MRLQGFPTIIDGRRLSIFDGGSLDKLMERWRHIEIIVDFIVYLYAMIHKKKLRITQDDFLLANRRASRAEEIEKFGKQIIFRTHTHRSKKTYDRNRLKRAYIRSDEGSFDFIRTPVRRRPPRVPAAAGRYTFA